MAGNVDGQRQLAGFNNVDDWFHAASSPDRLPSVDPDRTHKGPFEQLGTGRSVLAWRCLFLVSRFSVGLVPSNQSVLGDGLTGV